MWPEHDLTPKSVQNLEVSRTVGRQKLVEDGEWTPATNLPRHLYSPKESGSRGVGQLHGHNLKFF